MINTHSKPRVTSLAPQFLVDDLRRSITYYEKLGFTFGEPWDGFYVISPDDPHSPKPIIGKQRNPSLINAQVSYLLETRWLKPLPVRSTKGKIGKLSVDIVQTDVNGEQVDFALDQVTHLTLRVSRYNADDNKTAYTVNLHGL